ncbi:hypothetical protein FIBSPDRAFT_916895 [Athelia psychrophila]|uniref:GYF domain-containing protein n=1 Tax=Athelia psychrophila TaxID=1759441 RepID=A0A166U137_9AGAM|nr:hypothetical protein FIBSPDRAFT_916895 [Fibularhizoctonia sp. CBS 109695]
MSETGGDPILDEGHPPSDNEIELAEHEDQVSLKEVGKADAMPLPILEATVEPGTSSARPSEGDADSTRSFPAAQQPARVPSRQSTRHSSAGPSPTTPHRPQRTIESSVSTGVGASRHRSVTESRASNRLSGFFSSLIHRRDGTPTGVSRSGLREDRAASPAPVDNSSGPVSRSESPMPTRAITPPPSLPPPTLQELGLSLAALTADLSPSHFSSPPCSGAFLAPHYLLLCHAQGLDVLPLISPPAPQPYALVRRVNFKSIVVMEQRGVLVAIAGRRDGVRVYALEEVKKAVEWRIDVEVRRERERMRRDESKKPISRSASNPALPDPRNSSDKDKGSLFRPSTSTLLIPGSTPSSIRSKATRRSTPPSPTTPKSVPTKRPKPPPQLSVPPFPQSLSSPQGTPEPIGRPPPYTDADTNTSGSILSVARSRRPSGPSVLAGQGRAPTDPVDSKADDDWFEGRGSSDEEAIDIVAAGASGSQALDERTSGNQPSPNSHGIETTPITLGNAGRAHSIQPSRHRPANLDLTLTRANTIGGLTAADAPPSPVPSILSLRQALSELPAADVSPAEVDDDDDEPSRDTLSLAQMLMESRIPDLPPAGTRRDQTPIIIGESTPSSPREDVSSRPSTVGRSDTRRRRRWSVLEGFFNADPPPQATDRSTTAPPTPNLPTRARSRSTLVRSRSSRQGSTSAQATPTPSRPSSAGRSLGNAIPPIPSMISTTPSTTPSHSRFISRIISNAFNSRRSEEQPQTLMLKNSDATEVGRKTQAPAAGQAPPPKLEYVKLPGTKGALMIKAVETNKKSFLAILCGENGEKVELFAGTYRTALGLSRTFILPDSPRSLELQLQGDDLVEVFLMFGQNVFGLEPATVRVREVRIGRAERRAARRRAREIRTGTADLFDTDGAPVDDEDTNVSLNIGVSVAAGAEPVVANGDSSTPVTGPGPGPSSTVRAIEAPYTPPTDGSGGSALAHAEELVVLATAQMGPYTTFQQLTFAPNFPLASIADEYIIPPTYPEFLDYRAEHEPEVNGSNNVDLAQIQFSPPGLPVPTPSPPSKWFYRDPKGVIHGPWKASLMHAWYKDGLLPPDLPVRKEEDPEYTILKDLRLLSVDPTHPFRSVPPLSSSQASSSTQDIKPLLQPISLLSQPRHYGPPALFFSSRGGHSTTIVDARGRSVLKGRFLWSTDSQDNDKPSQIGKMGDVKRLEAFDVRDRSVIVAMRHGGLEAMDLGDALLKPGDESRTILPNFAPPPSNTNRRGPFVWKIGTPIVSTLTPSAALSNKSKGGLMPKKQSTGPGKSPAKSDFNAEGEVESPDEVMFLGRSNDEMYLCERNAGSFRILRLSPS